VGNRLSIRLFIARALAAVLASTLILGCSATSEPKGIWAKLWKLEVGPDYQRPAITQADQFRSEVGPTEAQSLADLPWWQVFDDKALQQLIIRALTDNYDLQLAAARVEQARAFVGVTAAEFYPQVGYQAFAGREKTFVPLEQTNGNVTFNAFSAVLNVAWELDVWGRIRRSTEAARASLFAQEDVRRGVMLTLVSDVADNYFRLLEFDREMAIAQESSRTFKQTLDLFSQRFQFGRDSKLPVARAQAAYDSSLAQIALLQRAIAQQENAISILLGSYPKAIERGTPLTGQSSPKTPVGLPSDLLQRRPDILQAEQNMIGANAEIGVAVANFFPRIGLSALYGGQSQDIDRVFNSSFSIWNIFGDLSGPIFQGGRLLETYYGQQAFWDGAIAQYKQTVISSYREVSDALIAQQTLVTQREAYQSQVQALRDAVDLSLLRYDAGRASYFEVLEGEQQLFPAEDAVAQTQRDELLAVVDLYKALGGGWQLSNADWSRLH
jgi:outer membrane protein, multidrug efflux system